jgi:hypothetical protein
MFFRLLTKKWKNLVLSGFILLLCFKELFENTLKIFGEILLASLDCFGLYFVFISKKLSAAATAGNSRL